ncbi:hypothetical protein I6A84_01415 [Frankia sp. CNm7]|uniref:Uncharacterized protein n=1 Tax=Frankia nepalensis TaxID=1836974 RepID=A0A937RFB9_9ACTN|nr:hypothetical protein [Frankia nepalensis]MBL7497998.1 hypothetical protein [Frankia nepalensis]MBL7509080.1 hypothetical protein [Frankia nepalensis]MBL7516817.1 hypothetical protein [Frankia nepalensis]MBL7627814.1 hypothetical protein [Frankia nepalensis]
MSDAVSDGIRTFHVADETADPDAVLLAHQVEALASKPADPEAMLAGLERLHDDAAARDPLGIADELVRVLVAGDVPADRVRAVGRWLAENGSNRGAVALGLVLLGHAGDERDRDLIVLLGALDTLTLYAAVALARSQPDREQALFLLAQRVDGWGRIHVVHRLADTTDPQIKDWLLRGGYRNTVLDDYLALLAATTGDLRGALSTEPVDEPLLDSAGGILATLADLEGPAGNMTDYPDAPEVIDRYLTLVSTRPPTVARVTVALRLAELLASGIAAWTDLLTWTWTDADRDRLWRRCRYLAEQPDWKGTVERALDDADLGRFSAALWPAIELGIPVRRRIHTRLRTAPNDGYLWMMLLDYDSADPTLGIDHDLALAAELLPLDDLVGTPTLELGFGLGEPLHTLDIVVSRLDEHPGKGWPLIRVALAAPTIRCRNMALKALETWPPDLVTSTIVEAVTAARHREPDDKVQAHMVRLLTSWTAST